MLKTIPTRDDALMVEAFQRWSNAGNLLRNDWIKLLFKKEYARRLAHQEKVRQHLSARIKRRILAEFPNVEEKWAWTARHVEDFGWVIFVEFPE